MGALFNNLGNTVFFSNLGYGNSVENDAQGGNDTVYLPDPLDIGRINSYGLQNGFHGGDGNDDIIVDMFSTFNLAESIRYKIYGDGGRDSIRGSAYSETMYGGDGDDSLNNLSSIMIPGIDHSDIMYGGAGGDVFGVSNGDTIMDMEPYELIGAYGTISNLDYTRYSDFTYHITFDIIPAIDLDYIINSYSIDVNSIYDLTFSLQNSYSIVAKLLENSVPIFTEFENNVVFDSIDVTIAELPADNALGGDDTVTLPNLVSGIAGWGLQNGFHGGDGNDTITGGAASVTIYGDAGNDILTGSTAADKLFGGDGIDTLNSANGASDDHAADELTGGAGSDQFTIGDGDTVKDAEVGELIVMYGTNVTISDRKSDGSYDVQTHIDDGHGGFTLATAHVASAATIAFSKSESNGLTYLTVTDAHDLFDDTANTVDFNTLDPTSFTGTYADAKAGDDSVILPSDGGHLLTWPQLQTGFTGGTGNDTITAGSSGYIIYGGPEDAGGLPDNDTIYGGTGADQIFGGDGTDYLHGSATTDDNSPDVLTGGKGADIFYVGNGDTITDLEIGEAILMFKPSDATSYFSFEHDLADGSFSYDITTYKLVDLKPVALSTVKVESNEKLYFSFSEEGQLIRVLPSHEPPLPPLALPDLPKPYEIDFLTEHVFKSLAGSSELLDEVEDAVNQFGLFAKDLSQVELIRTVERFGSHLNAIGKALGPFGKIVEIGEMLDAVVKAPDPWKEFAAQSVAYITGAIALSTGTVAGAAVGGFFFGIGALPGGLIGGVTANILYEAYGKDEILKEARERYDHTFPPHEKTSNLVTSASDDGVFHGTDQDDIVLGGASNDHFSSSDGANAYIGGGGQNTVDYSTAPSSVMADISTGSGGYSTGTQTALSNVIRAAAATTVHEADDVYLDISNITGSSFDDTIFGNDGENHLIGGNGKDIIAGGLGKDILEGGSDSDSFRGTFADLIGDTITDFGAGDKIVVEGERLVRGNLSGNGTQLEFHDSATGAVAFGSITLGGTLSGGDFMVSDSGSDAWIEYINNLPALADTQRVQSGNINGVANQAYLSGDNSSSFDVRLDRSIGYAGFDNTLGVFEVDQNGHIVDVKIIAQNVKTAPNSIAVDGVDPGHELGFFLVQNGAHTLTAAQAASNTLSFVADGTAFKLADDGHIINNVNTFLSFGAAANVDGFEHVLSGVSHDGSGSIVLGFEDLLRNGNSDDDFEDVVFSVLATHQMGADLSMVHSDWFIM